MLEFRAPSPLVACGHMHCVLTKRFLLKVRASLGKDTPQGTAQLLNSFTVENGPAQRMTYLLEVSLPLQP
jgi:hypothetical protein